MPVSKGDAQVPSMTALSHKGGDVPGYVGFSYFKHQLSSSPLLHQGTNTPRYGFGAWRSGGDTIYHHQPTADLPSPKLQCLVSIFNVSSPILAACEQLLTACLTVCLLQPKTAELSRKEAVLQCKVLEQAHRQQFPLSFLVGRKTPGGHPLPQTQSLQEHARNKFDGAWKLSSAKQCKTLVRWSLRLYELTQVSICASFPLKPSGCPINLVFYRLCCCGCWSSWLAWKHRSLAHMHWSVWALASPLPLLALAPAARSHHPAP